MRSVFEKSTFPAARSCSRAGHSPRAVSAAAPGLSYYRNRFYDQETGKPKTDENGQHNGIAPGETWVVRLRLTSAMPDTPGTSSSRTTGPTRRTSSTSRTTRC